MDRATWWAAGHGHGWVTKHTHDRVGGLAIQKLLSVGSIYDILMQLLIIFEMVETAKVLGILKINLNRSRCPLKLCSNRVCSPPKQPFSYLKFPLPNHWVLCYHFLKFLSWYVSQSVILFFFILFVSELCTIRGELWPVFFFLNPRSLCVLSSLTQNWCSGNIYSNNK